MGLDAFKLIKQGAESKVYLGTYLGKVTILKERFRKCYRLLELDEHLTKERMKAEVRCILRSKHAGICTPAVYLVDFDRRHIYMEYIENSITLKDFISETSDAESSEERELDSGNELKSVATVVGKLLGKMHKNNIIHGDLTSSNILVVHKGDELKVVLIDFGLSHIESSVEDKSVDLYVLERALISTHSNAKQLFTVIMKSYVEEYNKGSSEVLKKLEEVRSRGRKRTMVG